MKNIALEMEEKKNDVIDNVHSTGMRVVRISVSNNADINVNFRITPASLS